MSEDLLRRVDWRFLAGIPEPRLAYCPIEGPLREAVRTIAGGLVDEPLPGRCDLAVLRNPRANDLQAASLALAPGGALYAEWWYPVRGGAATVRRRLEARGLEQVVSYWPWPVPRLSPPHFWLPIERPHAVRWFLDNRRLQPPRAGSTAAAMVRALWRRIWRLGLLVPVCTVARKRPSADGGTPPRRGSGAGDDGRSLPAALALRHPEWAHGEAGGEASCLLITAGKSPLNKVVALVFPADLSEPRIALKLARVGEAQAGLEREAAILDAVHARRVRPGVPRVVERITLAGREAVAETVVTGEPILNLLRPETHSSLCAKVTELLGDLAAEAPRRSTAWRHGVAEPAIAALPPPEQARARAALARVGELPEVVEQRDCSPWNVLVQHDGSVAMLDWESAEERGVPGLDLTYFLTYAALFLDGTVHTGRELGSYERALTPATPTGRVFAECSINYARRVGLEPSTLVPLRLLCWLVHARSAQLRGSPGTSGGRGDEGLFLALARHELDRHERGATPNAS